MFKPTKKQHVVNKAYADKNGGALPPITADNIGQVLGVVADFDNVSPKEVIPEQTITIVDGRVEVTADWGPYAPNSEISAKMTFNGIEYDAIFFNGQYKVEIPNDEMYMNVIVELDYVDESPITFVDVRDDRDVIPGEYNISFMIMAPGAKYEVISY